MTEEIRCPHCGSTEHQHRNGHTHANSPRFLCYLCKRAYTPNPKPHAYSQEKREEAFRIYYSGVSSRGVGKIQNMSHCNIIRWLKKTDKSDENPTKTE